MFTGKQWSRVKSVVYGTSAAVILVEFSIELLDIDPRCWLVALRLAVTAVFGAAVVAEIRSPG